MDKYLYWLDRIDGLGPIAKRNLMEAFGSAKEVYYAQEKLVNFILPEKKQQLFFEAKKMLEMEKAYDILLKEKIKMISVKEDLFPQKLSEIPDPPFCLYYKGKLPDETLPSVAVIGARECSGYGEYIATELGKSLGRQGIQVISGMAKGIDGISQWNVLAAEGVSYGVLGCGVDICYPKSNRTLYEKLQEKGGILSTYPPGTKPHARLFPPRNRIVSGLCDVLVVIEARQRSGTSITVEMALEQGREIYAVPGRVTDRLSDGCNKLIKDGAHVFLSPEDFLMDLKELLPFKMKRLDYRKKIHCLGDKEEQVRREDEVVSQSLPGMDEWLLKCLDFYPKSLEDILEELQRKEKAPYKAEEVMTKLMYLCLTGLAIQDSPGWFSRQRS